MPKVTYILPAGSAVDLEVRVGDNLMDAAIHDDVDGIVGECGGVMTCATCHVFVDDEWAPRLPPASSDEHQMLDYTAAPRQPTSRLACQIVMTEALDGLRVRVADPQV